MENENLVIDFITMTGADELQALTWLEMANFNIEVAIQLFFENAEKGIERHDSEGNYYF